MSVVNKWLRTELQPTQTNRLSGNMTAYLCNPPVHALHYLKRPCPTVQHFSCFQPAVMKDASVVKAARQVKTAHVNLVSVHAKIVRVDASVVKGVLVNHNSLIHFS
ncbi:hypothetical protein CRM22_006393 [Opisthorchis felineus]|uniref:Uncharacterized protein n=1 Tax=Opisthorchis felineus TaxID=147828 RepID=A0A4S2LL79_OPIFE|nr:hypothetical protein CRM22_006393 [Opisthorchis felineus]